MHDRYGWPVSSVLSLWLVPTDAVDDFELARWEEVPGVSDLSDDYDYSGAVMLEVLTWLEDTRGVLFGAWDGEDGYALVLRPADKRFLEALDPDRYDPAELSGALEDLGLDDEEAVEAAADSLRLLRDTVERLREADLALLSIG